MSVDLNDPEIGRIRRKLLDPSSDTSWFLLHYNPSSTNPALSVVASGQNPIVPQWKEHLSRLQESGDAVVFGYGEFEGKGCILLYLNDSVAGVKRARAVVHSRAVAQLFPDYSALITMSKFDELTDSLINERLGLDYYQQRSVPSHILSSSNLASHDSKAPPPPAPKDINSSLPPAMLLGETLPTVPTNTTAVPSSQPVASTSATPSHSHMTTPTHTAPTTREVSATSPAQYAQESSSFRQNRLASGAGSETLPEPPTNRHRKTSLTARLGKAFGNPAMQSRPSEHSSESSPTSASGSSRIKSSFTKAFRRTSGSTSPQHSPRPDAHDGPPVPPKDGLSARSTAQAGESSVTGAYRTPSGGMGYAPPIVYVAPKEVGTSSSPGTFPEAVSGLYPARHTDNHLSPSPSAKRIMMDARIKSVEQEEEIQNRFRRGLHLNDKGPGAQEEVDDLDDDDDVRLPYDTSDHSVTDHLKADGVDGHSDETKTLPPMQIPRKPVDYGLNDTIDHGINVAGSADPTRDSDAANPTVAKDRDAASDSGALSEDHTREVPVNAADPVGTRAPDSFGLEEDISDRLRDEQRQHHDDGDSTATQQAEAAETLRRQQSEELARQVEAQRLREVEEQARLEAEALERAVAAAELQRHAEEYALQKEAERLREEEEQERRESEARRAQEEQERQEAEARRVQEELERQRKDEEEEKLRIALEEQHRMDQIRLVEEEARKRKEEEIRVEAERVEAERVRKEGIKQTLRDGKQRGGVMLRGHVTVQTMKNPTWRRRFFHLLPTEMQLFKNEADDKPIQTIHLGHGVSIEHTYEESQVQGSWKIVSGQEAFFVFADSSEEKETILEGLNIAIS